MINILIRIGLVRRHSPLRYVDGVFIKTKPRIRWPFHICPWHIWVWAWRTRDIIGVFRNRPGFIKWEKGRLLPRRWGFRILGFEVGDRG